jgi:hypothetical protein
LYRLHPLHSNESCVHLILNLFLQKLPELQCFHMHCHWLWHLQHYHPPPHCQNNHQVKFSYKVSSCEATRSHLTCIDEEPTAILILNSKKQAHQHSNNIETVPNSFCAEPGNHLLLHKIKLTSLKTESKSSKLGTPMDLDSTDFQHHVSHILLVNTPT